MFGKDLQIFAYKPLHGYRGNDDAVELPWERWEEEAAARGLGVADAIAEGRPRPERPV